MKTYQAKGFPRCCPNSQAQHRNPPFPDYQTQLSPPYPNYFTPIFGEKKESIKSIVVFKSGISTSTMLLVYFAKTRQNSLRRHISLQSVLPTNVSKFLEQKFSLISVICICVYNFCRIIFKLLKKSDLKGV